MTLAVKTCFCKGGRTGRRVGEFTHFRLVSRAGFPAVGPGPKAHNHTPVSISVPLPSSGSGWHCSPWGATLPFCRQGSPHMLGEVDC